jgi:uncharacterized coiled-coil DUF342 family protein
MAKKNLTDLLREEVKKSPEIQSETVQETTDDEHLEQDAEAVEKSQMNTPAKPSANHSTPTNPELEATVAELRAALEEAQHKEETFAELKESLEESYRKEGSLQQQIADLKSDLQHQKKSVHKLEKELEKIDQLKSELEQAKKAAFQLAEANEKLNQEIQTLKKEAPLKKEDTSLKVQRNDQRNDEVYHNPGRPIQKETEKPADFAAKSWLL